jgi:hypothetical protein
MREGILKAGVWQRGEWCWYRDTAMKEKTSGIGYEVNTTTQSPWLRLFHSFSRSGESVDYRITLLTTTPRFGGLRWWFLCPLVVNGRSCERRVGKLYLPPRGRYFGCRHCHQLTYRSCQEHDKRVDALRNNPDALWRLMDNAERLSGTQLVLALKAIKF